MMLVSSIATMIIFCTCLGTFGDTATNRINPICCLIAQGVKASTVAAGSLTALNTVPCTINILES